MEYYWKEVEPGVDCQLWDDGEVVPNPLEPVIFNKAWYL